MYNFPCLIGKKKKTQQKKKKNARKGKKAKKDLTSDRSQESLFKELVENGIIRKTEDMSIDSVFCQPSWSNSDLRKDPWWGDPPPNLWDVKQVRLLSTFYRTRVGRLRGY